jgi:uncharacterized cysteine cluster protein YcgN (CxxCxxCC family)
VASDVACRLLDPSAHRCRDFPNRRERVPDCTAITPTDDRALPSLPWSCAYRLMGFGFELPAWHQPVCSDPEAVKAGGLSMRVELVSDGEVDRVEEAPAKLHRR